MLILGLDIGTTSVKVALVRHANGSLDVLSSSSERHSADVTLSHHTYSEQNPTVICRTLEACVKKVLKEIDSKVGSKIGFIAICGQMHGCILWNRVRPSEDSRYYSCSNLITWQDQRCDTEFISGLPQPEKSVPLSTGYGCASLFWIQKNAADEYENYKCAGTIMDYVTASLCKLQKPIMSTQNAMSWGYYNFTKEKWNMRILQQSGFDTSLLPDIVPPNTVVGNLDQEWCGVPAGTKILVGLGDMQCSVLSCQPAPLTGVFSLGTSAQLCTVSPLHFGKAYYYEERSVLSVPNSLICVPYFGDLCLWTSPSLNGGAVFDMYAKALHEWTKRFVPSVTMDEIYKKLEEITSNPDETSRMRIHPTVYGERHAPDLKGSVENISPADISFACITKELAHGIIRNTFEMFRNGKMKVGFGDLTAVWGCGSPFEKNNLFRKVLEDVALVPCVFDKSMDAAVGAAASVNYTA